MSPRKGVKTCKLQKLRQKRRVIGQPAYRNKLKAKKLTKKLANFIRGKDAEIIKIQFQLNHLRKIVRSMVEGKVKII